MRYNKNLKCIKCSNFNALSSYHRKNYFQAKLFSKHERMLKLLRWISLPQKDFPLKKKKLLKSVYNLYFTHKFS